MILILLNILLQLPTIPTIDESKAYQNIQQANAVVYLLATTVATLAIVVVYLWRKIEKLHDQNMEVQNNRIADMERWNTEKLQYGQQLQSLRDLIKDKQ